MLAWFHSLCIENNLRYYVLGGTMLGAVRHKGFVPWDDDIDVGMPRSDYEKLAKIMGSDIHNGYLLETPSTEEKTYFYPLSKLYDTETTLVENTKYKIKRGIYIDIFPLDGIGNNYEDTKINFKSIKRKHNTLLLKVTGIRKGRKLYKNLGVMLFRLIPLNQKKLLKKLCNECSKRDFDSSEYVGNLVGAWGIKEVFPKDVMGKPTLYQFEDIMVYGAEKADEYLTGLYGDWSQLPPEEKRFSHHDFIYMNLEKSYLDN